MKKPFLLLLALSLALCGHLALKRIERSSVTVPAVPVSSQIAHATKSDRVRIARPLAQQESPAEAGVQTIEHVDWLKRLEEIIRNSETDTAKLEVLAGAIPEDDWSLVLTFLEEPDGPPAAVELALLILDRWAHRAPGEAAGWVARLPDNTHGQYAFRTVAAIWAEKDLTQALDWLTQLPDNGCKRSAQWSLGIAAAAQQQGAIAISLANELPIPERDSLLEYTVFRTASWDQSLDLANQVQDARLRETFLKRIAIEMGYQEPERAASLAATGMGPGHHQDDAVIQIASAWGRSAPAEVAAWVEQFPESDLCNTATGNLVLQWARTDPAEAGEWVARLPQGQTRDAAVNAYAPLLARSSPEQAAQLAGTIQDAALRSGLQARLRQHP